jgi:hypothetical protein
MRISPQGRGSLPPLWATTQSFPERRPLYDQEGNSGRGGEIEARFPSGQSAPRPGAADYNLGNETGAITKYAGVFARRCNARGWMHPYDFD